MSKNKKSPKSKKSKPKPQDPFDAGLDAEQVLADSLCKQFLQLGVEQDAIDDAFIGAFKGLGHRMLQIFKKEFVFELLEEVSHVDEEHVCDDCKETEENNSAPNKNTLH